MTSLLGYLNNTLFSAWQSSVQDRVEQWSRQALQLVRPFRYINFLRILKIAHHGLFLYGLSVFWMSNRLLLGSGNLTHSTLTFFRRPPNTWQQAAAQLTWGCYVFLGGGFPFYFVQHPTGSGWIKQWAHPVLYWGFFSVYKCIWSTWHTVALANFLTDPRRNPPPQWIVSRKYWNRIWRSCQRERIVQFQNLRYQHQWGGILQELNNVENQQLVKAVRIDNRWVAMGAFGAAVQDVLDDTLDRVLLRPHRVISFFQRLGTSFRHLQEISISMTLNLPVQAVSSLLESAPYLQYLKLDGVALSVHDLQPDLLEFGRSLHGVGSQHPLRLKTLLLEDCRLENDEPDPQLRTRYSMDLLLAPAIFTALTPPTRLALTELRLWVQCQRISAVELAVMLSQNTSLRTLDLYLTRDNSNDVDNDEDDDPVDWIILPLAQVLQYSNTTLTHLSVHLPTDIHPDTLSHRALVRMAHRNETLQSVCLIRSNTQARIRIPEMDFYLECNRLGRHDFRLESAEGTLDVDHWIEVLLEHRRNTSVIFYFLSMNPSLLLATEKDPRNYSRFRTKSLRKAWQLLQGKSHWATFAYDVKK